MFSKSSLLRWMKAYVGRGKKMRIPQWGYSAYFQTQFLKLTLIIKKGGRFFTEICEEILYHCTRLRDIHYFCQQHWRSHSTPHGWLFESAEHLAEVKIPNSLLTSYEETNIKQTRKHHHTIYIKLLCDYL